MPGCYSKLADRVESLWKDTREVFDSFAGVKVIVGGTQEIWPVSSGIQQSALQPVFQE